MFDRTVEFKKQVQAGAASQSLLNDAISLGTRVLTQKVKVDGQETSILQEGIGSIVGGFADLFGGGGSPNIGAGGDTESGLLTGAGQDPDDNVFNLIMNDIVFI